MRLLLISMSGIVLLLAGCNAEGAKTTVKLETMQQKVSYSVGYDIAQNFKANDFKLDLDLVRAGLEDGQSGAVAKLDKQQMGATMMAFQKQMIEQQKKKTVAQAQQNSAAGKAFLQANKGQKGVITLASGLQYEILQAGTGPKPTLNDVVQVHYTGTLIDGKKFDSSYDRGKPVEFPVSRVIAGWTEALQLMPVGSKWKLFIPAKLAYGSQAMGNVIGPNSVLIFDVELLKIVAPATKPEVKAVPSDKTAADNSKPVVAK